MTQENFVVETAALKEAVEALRALPVCYSTAVSAIRTATETLLDRKYWRGKSREEFKATYRIVEHYLEDDTDLLESVVNLLEGFYEAYRGIDELGVTGLVHDMGDISEAWTKESAKKLAERAAHDIGDAAATGAGG